MSEAGKGRSGDGEQDAPDPVAHSPASELKLDLKRAGMLIRKLNRLIAAKEQRIQKLLALGDRTVLHLEAKTAKCQHAALLKDWVKECGR